MASRNPRVTIQMTKPHDIDLKNQHPPMVDDNSGITYLSRAGTGSTIVILHGIGSNAESFASLFNNFDRQEHLIAWNAPGYRGSTAVAASWPTAEDYAEALLRFLDNLQIDRITLLGHSLGCLIAGAFTARNPDRVHHLVLASPALGYRVPVGSEMPAPVAGRLLELQRMGAEKFAATRSPRLIHEPDLYPDLVDAVHKEMARIDPEGYGQAVRMLASGDLEAQMKTVSIKPGFIIGACDTVTPVEQTARAARAWETHHAERPSIEKIAGAGHALYLQEPKKFLSSFRTLTGAV